jgi:hypothetical protein
MPENQLRIVRDKVRTMEMQGLSADDVKNADELRYFAVYRVDRAYGGPEEGGWWFDYGEVEERFPITCEEDAQALFEIAVKAGYDNEGRRPIWSVASDGVFEFIASWSLPMDWPEASPRYE